MLRLAACTDWAKRCPQCKCFPSSPGPLRITGDRETNKGVLGIDEAASPAEPAKPAHAGRRLPQSQYGFPVDKNNHAATASCHSHVVVCLTLVGLKAERQLTLSRN